MIWLELPSRLIVGWTLIDPAARGPSFGDTLRQAMRSPLAGPPRRPARVRVTDEGLAAEARVALATDDPVGARTEVVVAPAPEVAELVRQFAASLPPGDERDSYLEDGRVPAAAVHELFRAPRCSTAPRRGGSRMTVSLVSSFGSTSRNSASLLVRHF